MTDDDRVDLISLILAPALIAALVMIFVIFLSGCAVGGEPFTSADAGEEEGPRREASDGRAAVAADGGSEDSSAETE